MKPLRIASAILSGFFFLESTHSKDSSPSWMPGSQIAVTASASSSETENAPWRFLIFVSEDESEVTEDGWPLLLYLHGRSVRGEDLETIKRYGPPSFVEKRSHLPLVVVSPQLPDGAWPAQTLNALLNELLERYPIDPKRVYLSGVSLGAMGAWTFAGAYPGRIAALVPICAHGPPSVAPKLVGMPIWAFHGAMDSIVPIEPHQELIQAINKAGGQARLTIDPEADHGTVIEPAYGTPELWTWLLSQKRDE
ncbi:MAG: alpha/beta fold hydrolase [Verrucomicrobiota bacterium]